MSIQSMIVRNNLTELANILQYNKELAHARACSLINQVRVMALSGVPLVGSQKERLIYYALQFGINLSENLEVIEADVEPSPAFERFLTEKRTPFGEEGSSNLADLMYEMKAEKD